MKAFKKNARVIASTLRGAAVAGKVSSITSTAKGDWYTIKPDDKSLREFKTRAGKIVAA